MLAILMVNHRTVEVVLACVHSFLVELTQPIVLHLLDNGSGDDDVQRLSALAAQFPNSIRFHESGNNLGFAGGMNLLLAETLANPTVDRILLLNSDTLPTPGFIAAMEARLDPVTRTDMVAAKLLNPQSKSVDSLGITLYRSTLASNRKREDEILLGPSGGCALLTRRLLEDLHASHGEWFDERFFCYAEDTDLVLRARWLGYRPAFAADAVVYHEGSLSSGGPNNDFVLYHGIRNSLWWLVKDAPSAGYYVRCRGLFCCIVESCCVTYAAIGRACYGGFTATRSRVCRRCGKSARPFARRDGYPHANSGLGWSRISTSAATCGVRGASCGFRRKRRPKLSAVPHRAPHADPSRPRHQPTTGSGHR